MKLVQRYMAVAAISATAMAPVALADDGVILPDYQVVRLDNGLRFILVEKSDVPLIAFHARIEGGGLADAPGREGTAEVLAELLQKGAGDRDALAFSQAVDNVGGRLDVSASSEALALSGEFMARDRELMLELLSDLLMRPTLEASEFEKIRERQIQGIAAAKDNSPNAIMQSYFEAFVFEGHPYGRASDETSLAALTHEDVGNYFREHVGADRAIMAFVGDFDSDALRGELAERFGAWDDAAGKAPEVAAAAPLEGRRVLLVDKPDATQTFFWIGNVGVARDDADRVALDVANTAFGGRFTSMLNTELRVETGLTYGARSALIRRRAPGVVAITSYTKTESTEEAIDRALGILERLRNEGLSDETVESVKTYVTGLFPLQLETGNQLASRLTEIEFYGLGRDDVDNYASGILGASDEEIRQVISRVYPAASDLTFVLVGQAAAVREVAAKYGEVVEMSITDKSFSPTS